MKTNAWPFFLLLITFVMTSCGAALQIEKRHYRGGWYVSLAQQKKAPAPEKHVQEETEAYTLPPATVQLPKDTVVPASVQPSAHVAHAGAVRKEIASPAIRERTELRKKDLPPPASDEGKKSSRKKALVTTLSALSALCFLLALIFLASSMVAVFLLLGAFFGIAAIGIYLEKTRPLKKAPETQDEAEKKKNDGMKVAAVLFGVFMLLMLGLLVALLYSLGSLLGW